jgi:hypothetical protein
MPKARDEKKPEKERKSMKTTANAGTADGWRWALALLAAMTVGLFGVLLAQGPAQAHDHRIPQAVLMKGAKELQAGTLVKESSWDRFVEDGVCENQNAFYRMRFPETDSVAAGSKLRVRISKRQGPDSFEIAVYRMLDENGQPSGEARLLKRTLERVVVDGKTVGWDAAFSVNRPSRDYYLIAEGLWQDREGCGNKQFAYWSFHVKTGA